jgi:hypothetical protein
MSIYLNNGSYGERGTLHAGHGYFSISANPSALGQYMDGPVLKPSKYVSIDLIPNVVKPREGTMGRSRMRDMPPEQLEQFVKSVQAETPSTSDPVPNVPDYETPQEVAVEKLFTVGTEAIPDGDIIMGTPSTATLPVPGPSMDTTLGGGVRETDARPLPQVSEVKFTQSEQQMDALDDEIKEESGIQQPGPSGSRQSSSFKPKGVGKKKFDRKLKRDKGKGPLVEDDDVEMGEPEGRGETRAGSPLESTVFKKEKLPDKTPTQPLSSTATNQQYSTMVKQAKGLPQTRRKSARIAAQQQQQQPPVAPPPPPPRSSARIAAQQQQQQPPVAPPPPPAGVSMRIPTIVEPEPAPRRRSARIAAMNRPRDAETDEALLHLRQAVQPDTDTEEDDWDEPGGDAINTNTAFEIATTSANPTSSTVVHEPVVNTATNLLTLNLNTAPEPRRSRRVAGLPPTSPPSRRVVRETNLPLRRSERIAAQNRPTQPPPRRSARIAARNEEPKDIARAT